MNVESQMFKLFQWFPFTDNERYLYNAFQEESLKTDEWVRNLKNILESYVVDILIKNMFYI